MKTLLAVLLCAVLLVTFMRPGWITGAEPAKDNAVARDLLKRAYEKRDAGGSGFTGFGVRTPDGRYLPKHFVVTYVSATAGPTLTKVSVYCWMRKQHNQFGEYCAG